MRIIIPLLPHTLTHTHTLNSCSVLSYFNIPDCVFKQLYHLIVGIKNSSFFFYGEWDSGPSKRKGRLYFLCF